MWMIFNPVFHCNPSMENARQDNWDSSYCTEGHLATSVLLKARKKGTDNKNNNNKIK